MLCAHHRLTLFGAEAHHLAIGAWKESFLVATRVALVFEAHDEVVLCDNPEPIEPRFVSARSPQYHRKSALLCFLYESLRSGPLVSGRKKDFRGCVGCSDVSGDGDLSQRIIPVLPERVIGGWVVVEIAELIQAD